MVIDFQKTLKELKEIKKKKSRQKNILSKIVIPTKSKKKSKLKKILRKTKVSYKIPEYKKESIFEDPNRFFKDEFNEEKRSMFFK